MNRIFLTIIGVALLLTGRAEAQNAVTVLPSINSALKIVRSLDLNTTDLAIKAGPGNLYGYYFYNAAASARFIKIYNATTANVTVGTTTPLITIPLPAGAAAHVHYTSGITFDTAISAACTTALADNDTGAPTAGDCVANFFYK